MTNVISNPADKLKIKSMIKEISDSYFRKQAEQELIKEITEAISKDYGIDKPQIKKMADTYYKQNFSEIEAKNEEFSFMYEDIMGTEE